MVEAHIWFSASLLSILKSESSADHIEKNCKACRCRSADKDKRPGPDSSAVIQRVSPAA